MNNHFNTIEPMNVLINSTYLKEFSPIPLNFQTDELWNYVKLAETIYVLPLIGEACYNELLQQVEGNSLTLENSALLAQAIYPLLGFATAYEALPTIWAHINEVGLTKGKSDNADSLDMRDVTYVENHLKRQVDARSDYAKSWIKANASQYPLIKVEDSDCPSLPSNDSVTGLGIYSLPRRLNLKLK